jgi:hypothetical protein
MLVKFSGYFLVLHPVACDITILNESTTFCNQLWVFSLLFYTALHVWAYKQDIFRCYLTNYKKGQVTEFLLCGSTESQYYYSSCIYSQIQYKDTMRTRCYPTL